MRTILSLRGHRYLRTFGSFLIVIALVAGIASCAPVDKYELTMAVAPAGGGNATDETGTSPYAEGTVVNITAVVASCYRFVNWSAPAGTFGNATAAETTFTMPARDVTVTANFELTPPDHFKFYHVDWDTAPIINKEVKLVDEFGTVNTEVSRASHFGNPVEKVHNDVVTPISDPNRHYTLYYLSLSQYEITSYRVVVKNQFGDNQELTVTGPAGLLVPTQKEGQEEPACLNHFLVYAVTDYETFPFVNVHLEDQFLEEDVDIGAPIYFANPVQKTVDGEVTEIVNEAEHMVFYSTQFEAFSKTVQIENQFGPQTIDVEASESTTDMLAVPSEKISWEKPLDHFKVYPATGSSLDEDVLLVDQFGNITATVLDPCYFANPVAKIYNEQGIYPSNWDNHLTLYNLDTEDYGFWELTVNNQFGKDQLLFVEGPLYLAVPTKKADQDMPVGLDHFLVYEAFGAPFSASVALMDQWIPGLEKSVDEAFLFANPVQKTHDSTVTEIMNDEHLVFYWIDGGTYSITDLPITNQFGQRLINVSEEIGLNTLAVPSEKVTWSVYTP